VDKRVYEAMTPYFLEIYGNPSSNHEYGKQARIAVEKARKQVASLINAQEEELIFTSGATEAINLAIKGFVEANHDKGNHIITVKTEHKAVLNTCEYLETKGIEVTYLEVDENGLVKIEDLRKAVRDSTILIVIMYVNNEIGVIQPIKEIGRAAKENNIVFFCDATQAVGKIPVDVIDAEIDMLCFSAHKLNGPKGIGILYKRNGIGLTPIIHGGGQENGLRGGTYNTPLIVGMGKACAIASEELDRITIFLETKRTELEEYFEKNKIGLVNFKNIERAPHILSITLNDIEAEEYLIQNADKIAASTGSACNSSIIQDSHVLTNIFRDTKLISRTIRLSISK
jgi:cysteine desulfurase